MSRRVRFVTLRPSLLEVREVTMIEVFYLFMVIGAGTAFAVTLGYLSWEYEKRNQG